jgi:molybdopterin-guanine dinucleotide biosynthesis protein A
MTNRPAGAPAAGPNATGPGIRSPGGSSARPTTRLLGAVLAGGRSRRFGSDKAVESVGGATLLDRAADTLTEVFGEVVIVSARPVETDRRVVPDARDPCGPLGGIEAALAHAVELGLDGAFVLACDLPVVTADTVRDVARALDSSPTALAAAPAGRDGRSAEPLCAAYRVACLGEVRALLDDGRLAAVGLFDRVGGVIMPRPDDELLNVNTRADRDRAERVLAERLLAERVDEEAKRPS